LRFELQVLTLTELVSTGYYRMLRKYSPDGPLAAMCELILRDEAGHVAFQRETHHECRRAAPRMRGWLWRIQFLLCRLRCRHRSLAQPCALFKSIGGTRWEFYSEITRQITRFIRSLRKQEKHAGIPALWPNHR